MNKILHKAKCLRLFFRTSLLLFLFLFSSQFHLQAQENLTTDELFLKARNAAFEEDNYPKAISLTKEALAKSPDYADVRIFLGRLYSWTDKVDSARVEFKRVLVQNPGHEDGS